MLARRPRPLRVVPLPAAFPAPELPNADLDPMQRLASAVILNALHDLKTAAAPYPAAQRDGGVRYFAALLEMPDNGALEFWCDVLGADYDIVLGAFYNAARMGGLL